MCCIIVYSNQPLVDAIYTVISNNDKQPSTALELGLLFMFPVDEEFAEDDEDFDEEEDYAEDQEEGEMEESADYAHQDAH